MKPLQSSSRGFAEGKSGPPPVIELGDGRPLPPEEPADRRRPLPEADEPLPGLDPGSDASTP